MRPSFRIFAAELVFLVPTLLAAVGCEVALTPPDGGATDGAYDAGGPGRDAGVPSDAGAGTCTFGGAVYRAGERFAHDCNTCTCTPDGLVGCTTIACNVEPPCAESLPSCAAGTFCQYPEASCRNPGAVGSCAARPEVCTTDYSPVCGCDGSTYGNACAAAAAGVSVDFRGPCGVAQCTTDADCPQVPCACLDQDQDGSCENHCPIMGCRDGACVDVSGPQGSFCGGIAGIGCPSGEFCDFDVSTQCGSGDQGGTCTPVPSVCDESYAPVCGCDARTYSNACHAAAQGVSVAAAGACSTGSLGEGEACGGFRPTGAARCASGLFCQHKPGALCGAADAPGECTAVPQICTTLYQPVCGCDGKTYSNTCAATAAQVGILAEGACP